MGWLEVQHRAQLYIASEFKVGLNFMRPCFRKIKLKRKKSLRLSYTVDLITKTIPKPGGPGKPEIAPK